MKHAAPVAELGPPLDTAHIRLLRPARQVPRIQPPPHNITAQMVERVQLWPDLEEAHALASIPASKGTARLHEHLATG
eukprot:2610925-Alexandrium_andersonii.AAC.1